MKTLADQLTITSVDLEIKARPSRSADCNLSINQIDLVQELSWPGATGRIEIRNQAQEQIRNNGYRLKVFLMCSNQLSHLSLVATLPQPITNMFSNGYNDWTAARQYRINEQQGRTRLILRYLAGAMTDNHFVEPTIRGSKSDKRSHEWTILSNNESSLFIGSLNDFDAFTYFELLNSNRIIIHRDVNGWSVNKETCVLDLWVAELPNQKQSQLFDTYFQLKELPALRTKPATGYTSWYYHYNQISPNDIDNVVNSFQINQIPIDFIQIDDGTQKRVGDWLDLKPEFGQSLKPLVDKIHGAGFKAGLWLAPFVAEAKSDLIKNHPDWVAKDERGRRIRAGFNPLWSYWFYVLDLQNQEVRNYLKNVFQVVLNDWGFDLLKLDFLYAAALQHPTTMTRAQLMSDAVDLVHEATGWKSGQPHSYDKKNGPLLLGCGIPPSAAVGKFDFCRIGSDVKESWEDNLLKFMKYQERVSTYNSLLSTIGRWPYNGRGFWNDPDVFYLRQNFRALKPKEKKKKLPMTEVEKTTLLLLNHVFGSLIFTSDPVHQFDEEKMNRYKLCFPYLDKEIKQVFDNDRLYSVHFTIKTTDRILRYCLISNLRNKKTTAQLETGLWFSSFLHKQGQPNADWFYSNSIDLQPHESKCLLYVDDQFAGSTGHIFPGSDILVYPNTELWRREHTAPGEYWLVVAVDEHKQSAPKNLISIQDRHFRCIRYE